MKRLIAIALIFLSLFTGYAKAGTNYYWTKSYGGSGSDGIIDVKVLPDGSIIAVGLTNSSGAGGYDVLVMKLSPDGEVIWAKTYGGSSDDGAFAVAIAENGDIIVAGGTESFGAGSEDVWVLRLDENGNVKWQKTYGGSDIDRAYAVAIAENGDIIVAGVWGSLVGMRVEISGFSAFRQTAIFRALSSVKIRMLW